MTGIRLGDKTLQQFKAGETTREWLLAVVGPPTSETTLPSNHDVQVLRYSTIDRPSGLTSLFTGGGAHTTATIYFVVTNGVVTNFWADRETEHTLFGKEVEKKSGEKEK